MKTRLKLALAACALVLAACGGGGIDGWFKGDCSDEMNDLKGERGEPQEVTRFDSGDYHSHTFWYWRSGFSRNFTWGGPVDSCETSDYSFSPIR